MFLVHSRLQFAKLCFDKGELTGQAKACRLGNNRLLPSVMRSLRTTSDRVAPDHPPAGAVVGDFAH